MSKIKLQKNNKHANSTYDRADFIASLSVCVLCAGAIMVNVANFAHVFNEYRPKKTKVESSVSEDVLAVSENNNLYENVSFEQSTESYDDAGEYTTTFDIVSLSYEEKIIMKYCAIYQVDYETVYNKLSELTNNFTSNEYNMGMIPGITFKKRQINFDNPELLLAMSVRYCKQNPEGINLSKEIISKDKFKTNLDIYQQITEFSNLFNVDRNIIYSIICAECGFGSSYTDESNNFGSIKFDNSFVKFDNSCEGIMEICAEIYRYYIIYDIHGTPNEQLKQIQEHYAPLYDENGKPIALNENWLKNAMAAYKEAVAFPEIYSDELLEGQLINDQNNIAEYFGYNYDETNSFSL